MSKRDFVVLAAMPEELAPFLDPVWRAACLQDARQQLPQRSVPSYEQDFLAAQAEDPTSQAALEQLRSKWDPSKATLATKPKVACQVEDLNFYPLRIGRRRGWAAVSGIGIANAARAAAIAILSGDPHYLIYLGTTGGLSPNIQVGQLIVGTHYQYHQADATAFGYQLGQIPGMPAKYPAAADLIAQVRQAYMRESEAGSLALGEVVSADSFITADNIDQVAAHFPRAIATDMESAAAAQVAWRSGRKFLSLRAVSDLCSPQGAAVFHTNTHIAAGISAQFCWDLLSG